MNKCESSARPHESLGTKLAIANLEVTYHESYIFRGCVYGEKTAPAASAAVFIWFF
jgi:hypothetical protein